MEESDRRGMDIPERSNEPMQMEGFQKRVIAPILKKKKIAWHGWPTYW